MAKSTKVEPQTEDLPANPVPPVVVQIQAPTPEAERRCIVRMLHLSGPYKRGREYEVVASTGERWRRIGIATILGDVEATEYREGIKQAAEARDRRILEDRAAEAEAEAKLAAAKAEEAKHRAARLREASEG
jgi:hypothetical protein